MILRAAEQMMDWSVGVDKTTSVSTAAPPRS